MREICFDTETTGLKTEEGDRVIEIGCVEIIDGKQTENYFHEYLNPEREISDESVRITGLTAEFLSDKPVFKDIADKFLDYVGDSVLIAHNANFDMKFMNNEYALIGREPLKNQVIDSLAIAKKQFPGQKNNLDALCKRFGIDASKRTLHGALLDAQLLTEVYLELCGGSQETFNTETTEKKKLFISINELLETVKKNKKLEPRNFSLTEEELQKHKDFIEKKVKNNLWYPVNEDSK